MSLWANSAQYKISVSIQYIYIRTLFDQERTFVSSKNVHYVGNKYVLFFFFFYLNICLFI